MTRKWKAIRQLLAMGFGLGPGFLLPLVLAWRMAPAESDRMIALMTMSVIGSAVITAATEAYAVAELARFSEHGYSYKTSIAAVHRQMLPKSALATLLTALVVGLSFVLSGSMEVGTAVWLFAVAAGVFLTCIASSYAAVLILNERSHTPLALQGLRHIASSSERSLFREPGCCWYWLTLLVN